MPSAVAATVTFLKAVGLAVGGLSISAGTALAIGAATVVAGAVAASKLIAELYKVPSIDGERSRQATVRGTVEPQKLIYGQALVSGPISFVGVAGNDNRDLYHAIVLAGHPSDSISDIYFDDERIANSHINAAGNVTTGTFGPKGGTTICVIRKLTGDQTTADSVLDGAFATINSSEHIGTNLTYIVTKFTLTEDSQETWDKFMPNDIKALVKGKKVYDPRQDSTSDYYDATVGVATQRASDSSTWKWSENPVWCLVDYLTDDRFGMGISLDRIDLSKATDAADVCDATVSVPGGSEKRYTCNGVVFGTATHKTNINKILSSMNGMLTYTNGKYVIRAGAFEAVGTGMTLTEDHMIGPVRLKTSFERNERFNTITGTFIDPSKNYKEIEFPKVQIASALTRDNNEELIQELKLSMTNSSYMAQRIAHKLIQLSDLQKVLTFPTNLAGVNISVGDRVNVTLSEFGYTNKTFVCLGWTLSDSGTGGVNLTLREDDSSSYADLASSGYSTVTPAGGIQQGFFGVPDPSGLSATAHVESIELDWTNPANMTGIIAIEVFASPNSSWSSAVKIGETIGTQFIHDESNSVDSIVEGDQRYYWVRARRFPAGEGTDAVSDRNPDSDTSTVQATKGALGALSGLDTVGDSQIDDNAVTNRTIADNAVDTDQINDGAVNTDQIADDAVDITKIANTLQSTNYVAATSGWKLTTDGTFEAGDGTFRGAITATSGSIANTVTIGGTAASTVESGAASGATALQNGDDITDGTVGGVTITSTKLYQGTGTFNNSNTGFYLDSSGQFSLKDKLSFNGTTLSVSGAITATSLTLSGTSIAQSQLATGVQTSLGLADSALQDGDTSVNLGLDDGSIAGISINSTKLYAGTGTWANSNTGFYLDNTGKFSLKDKFFYNPTNNLLTVDGNITADVITAKENLVVLGDLEASSMAAGSITRAMFSQDALDEIYAALATSVGGSNGDYKDASGSFTTSGGTVTVGTSSDKFDHGTADVVVEFLANHYFYTTTNYTTAQAQATLNFEVSADGTFTDLTSATKTQTLQFGEYDLSSYYGYTYLVYFFNGEHSKTFTTGSGNDIPDNTELQFRVRVTGVGTAFTSQTVPFTVEANEGVTGVVSTGGNADTLDNLDSTKFLRSDVDDTFDANLTITGNLTVNGTQTTLNTATLQVEDKNIVLNYGTGDTSGSADGAGITIQDAVNSSTDATILWNATTDKFDFSHGIDVTGATTLDGYVYVNVAGNNLVLQSDSVQRETIQWTQNNVNRWKLNLQADGDLDFVPADTADKLLYNNNEIATQSWVTSQGYVTSFSETDTLATVTGRGATTNTRLGIGTSASASYDLQIGEHLNISSGHLYVDGTVRINENGNATFNTISSGQITSSGSVTAGNASTSLGFYVGTTQVIQGSTRNLVNIGTIGSGSISSSGDITATGRTTLGRTASDRGAVSDTNTPLIVTSLGVDHTASQTNVLRLQRDGTSGVVYAGLADIDLERWENSSVASRTAMHFKLGHSNLNVINSTTVPTILTLRSNGNVGINKTAPNNALDIDSSYTNSVRIAGTGSYLLHSYHDSGGVGWATGSGASWDNLLYLDGLNDMIRLYTGQNERLRIQSTGADLLSGNMQISNGKLIIKSSSNGFARIEGTDANHMIIMRGDRNSTSTGSDRTTYYQYGGSRAQGNGHLFYTGGALASQSLRMGIYNDQVNIKGFTHIGNATAAGYATDDGSWVSRLNVSSSVHAKIEVSQEANSMRSHWYAHTGQDSIKFGTSTGHDVEFQRNGTTTLELRSDRVAVSNQKFVVESTATGFDAIALGNSTQSNYTNMIWYSNSGNAQIWKNGGSGSTWSGTSALNIYNSNGVIGFHPQATLEVVKIDSTGLNMGSSRTIRMNGTTVIDSSAHGIFNGVRLGQNYLEKKFATPYFTNGVSNLAVDLTLGNEQINAVLEIEVTGGYSYQNTTGLIRRRWYLGFNANGSIWQSPVVIDETMDGPIVDHLYVSDPFWDSSASTYKIRIYKKNSWGNDYRVILKNFSINRADELLNNAVMGNLLTSTSTSSSHTYGTFSRNGLSSTNTITSTKNSNNFLAQTESNPSNYYAKFEANYNYANAFRIAVRGAAAEHEIIRWGDAAGLEFRGGSGDVRVNDQLNVATDSYEGSIVFGTSDGWHSGIRQHDDGDAELRIWHKHGTRGRIHIATNYDGEPANISRPTNGITVYGANGLVGIGNFSANTPNIGRHLHVKSDTDDAPMKIEGGNAWSGIEWADSSGSEFMWFRGGVNTWSFGGGGSSSNANKRIHCHGAMSIGASYQNTAVPNNGLLAEGEIKTASNVTAYASDRRLKENIMPIADPIEKIKRLQGVQFDWKADCEEKGFIPSFSRETGVIAQNVAEVVPDAVSPAPFDNDYLTVDKSKLVAVLIEAVKAQQETIETLTQRIEVLENGNHEDD